MRRPTGFAHERGVAMRIRLALLPLAACFLLLGSNARAVTGTLNFVVLRVTFSDFGTGTRFTTPQTQSMDAEYPAQTGVFFKQAAESIPRRAASSEVQERVAARGRVCRPSGGRALARDRPRLPSDQSRPHLRRAADLLPHQRAAPDLGRRHGDDAWPERHPRRGRADRAGCRRQKPGAERPLWYDHMSALGRGARQRRPRQPVVTSATRTRTRLTASSSTCVRSQTTTTISSMSRMPRRRANLTSV